MTRKQKLDAIQAETFDLVIVGGGVSGAGVFFEASKKGYKTLLIEKGDFSSGTSSKSAKLVHGGLRYLQFFYFKLVRESLIERNYLLETYPHIVKPIEFVYPLYQSSIKFRLGMIFYQMIGRHNLLSKYSFFNKKKTLKKLDAINHQNLKGGFSYYDGITNDSRLTTEIILEAKEYINATALNYFELVSSTQTDSYYSLNCFDHLTNNSVEIKTKYVVNCGGPWTDKILHCLVQDSQKFMAPSKGIHLVFSQDKIPVKSAYAFSSYANDKRMFYAVPWEYNSVIIGVTDTEYDGDLDNIEINQNDIDYVLHGINSFFPDLNVTEDDILSEFVGLRPLFKEEISSQDKTRDFKVWWSNSRVISLAGGKLTTFRAMAKTLISKLENKIEKCPAEKMNHPDTNTMIPESLDSDMVNHIKNKYGNKSFYLFNLIYHNPELGTWLDKEFQILNAEVAFFAKYQDCFYIDDILNRRLALGYVLKKHPKNKMIKDKIAQILNQYTELVNNEK